MTGQTNTQRPEKRPGDRPAWIALAFLLALNVLLRAGLLDIPLDRDEGGYAYGGQVILDGGTTYDDFYTMRYPAIFGAYAIIMAVFGETAHGLHLGLLVINSATALLLFLAGRSFFGGLGGLVTAATFIAVSLSGATEGFSGNAEHFVILFASAGIWALAVNRDRSAIPLCFFAGLAMAIAYLMKQHGIAFVVFGGAAILGYRWRCGAIRGELRGAVRSALPSLAFYALGVAAPIALTWAHLAITGRFPEFWYWTVSYAREYAVGASFGDGMESLWARLVAITPTILPAVLLAVVGIATPQRELKGDSPNHQRDWAVLSILALLSFASISIGFYYRPHYFRLVFPALALLAGRGACVLARGRGSAFVMVIAFLIPLYTVVLENNLLFRMTPTEASRTISGLNPFPESLIIGRWIAENTAPEETIAVIGSEPQIYFYAQRRAATGHIYTYQLMEPHAFARPMQDEMIDEIESARPSVLIVVDIPTSWLIRADSETHLLEWLDVFLDDHYAVAGRVDLVSRDETRYRWGAEAADGGAMAPYFITVYRRIE